MEENMEEYTHFRFVIPPNSWEVFLYQSFRIGLPILLFLFHLTWISKYFTRRESLFLGAGVLGMILALLMVEVYIGLDSFLMYALFPLGFLIWLTMMFFNYIQVDDNTDLSRFRKGFLFLPAPLLVMCAQPIIWMILSGDFDLDRFAFIDEPGLYIPFMIMNVGAYVLITLYSLKTLIRQQMLPKI